MGSQSRAVDGRSQRNELEQLQEELRSVQRQSEELPRENAELAARLAHLEKEVRSLREARDMTRRGWENTVASLPSQLVPPFCATPSRRTLYGRVRFALQWRRMLHLMRLLTVNFLIISFFRGTTREWPILLAGTVGVWIALHALFFQRHVDEDERLAWRFDEDGFARIFESPRTGNWLYAKVLYSEVRKVEVKQGWLRRLLGIGSVRVTWAPTSPTSLGKDAGAPSRVVDIDLLEEPQRLATWLRERLQPPSEVPPGSGHVR